MVRLLRGSGTEELFDDTEFQSHNGAIAANIDEKWR